MQNERSHHAPDKKTLRCPHEPHSGWNIHGPTGVWLMGRSTQDTSHITQRIETPGPSPDPTPAKEQWSDPGNIEPEPYKRIIGGTVVSPPLAVQSPPCSPIPIPNADQMPNPRTQRRRDQNGTAQLERMLEMSLAQPQRLLSIAHERREKKGEGAGWPLGHQTAPPQLGNPIWAARQT